MTASIPGSVWSLRAVAAQSSPAVADPRLNEVIALRRCAQYRKAFRCAAVSYPADILGLQAPADWIRRHGVAVDVVDTDGFARALTAGILPQRIIMHRPATAGTAEAGAGRFVVDSRQQVDGLATTARQRRRVLVDITDQDADDLVAAVIGGAGLDLIGVHRRLHGGESGSAAVRAMVTAMRGFARRYNVIPARLSLGDIDAAEWGCRRDDLVAIAAAVDDAVEDGCVASRFPSPAVNIAPSRSALIR
jgi:diaminopimelate decarboxylase